MAGFLHESLIWTSYSVAVGLAVVAGTITTFTWQTSRDRSPIVSAIAIVSLTSLLATLLLLPVDIALVSLTSSPADGAKRDWATPEHVGAIVRSLTITYYALYSFDALLCLIVIPFGYFWYEEYDEIEVEDGRSIASRVLSALKYTLGFVVLVAILILVGLLAPAAGKTQGHWDLDYFKSILAANGGAKMVSFALGLLMTLGTLLYIVYSSAGLALLPVSLIKSAPALSAPELSETTASALERNRERQRQLEMRHSGRSDAMPAKDRRELEMLVREERTLVRRERLAAEAAGEGRSFVYRVWFTICAVFRPIKLLGGILLFALAVVIWVSMLITGIDKAANSVCKQHCGYILGRTNLFQPMNWIFMQSARAFPVDYILMALLVLFLFSASLSGIANVGIRFLWVRIFQIRKGRTAPQALLIATVMLALIMLGINYAIVAMIVPQYATYGTQTFCSASDGKCDNAPELIVACSEALEGSRARQVCTPTVMSTFVNRITITWPLFGLIVFWSQFAFLAVYLIVALTAVFRTPQLNLAELDEDAEADEEESLLASTGRRFGATWQDITGRARSRDARPSRGQASSPSAP